MRIITFDIDGDWPESVKNPYYKPNDLARENTAYWNGVCATYDSAIEVADEEWDEILSRWRDDKTQVVYRELEGQKMPIYKFKSFSQYLKELIELKQCI